MQSHENNANYASARQDKNIEDTLLMCISWICKFYGKEKSTHSLLAGVPHKALLDIPVAQQVLRNAGMHNGLIERAAQDLPEQIMPMILLRKDKGGCLLLAKVKKQSNKEKKNYYYQVILPELGDNPVELSHEELKDIYSGYAVLVKPAAKMDLGTNDIPEVKGHWLFGTLWRYRRYYKSAALATLLVNILALATVFFTMNVYDRVIPNQAYVTLWSLATGVTVAIIFEAISRYVRSHLLDVAGKKADLILGNMIFRQALDIRMEHKPASSGAFANQIREFESIRDFMASATLAAVSDLPFVIFFIVIVFVIGGSLGWVPLLVLPVIFLISLLIQWPLASTMKENLRESSQKQGVLIESIEGMEILKATSGIAWMQHRWQRYSALQSATAKKSRHYSTLATGSALFLQQFQTVILVVTGVYLIDAGDLTQGALIGTVMLAGRATAPLSQVIGLAVRYQQTKAAMETLNKLMAMPVDRDKHAQYLSNPIIKGNIKLEKVQFSYPAPPMQANPDILKGVNIEISQGERVAIIGRIGSGKSTLLKIIARLYQPVKGKVYSDGLDVNQIDSADWYKAVGFISQDARLFSGTLRENIIIGNQSVTTKEFVNVLKMTGLDKVAAKHPAGINMPVGEGGNALSGGQKQLISLARTLISKPNVLLLDEPTSAMDTQTEQQFINQLRSSMKDETLIIVTHRASLLELVNRIIVIDDGQVVLDGPKDDVLKRLKANQ